ncbi:MAG: anti-sigma factor family protein [Bryobacteraceae bacterium]
MPDSRHVPEQDLIRFADGEMQGDARATVESHLRTCAQCRSRLDELQGAAAAYSEYHAQVLKPSLDIAREWPRLPLALPDWDRPKSRFNFHALLWAGAALVCCLAVLALFFGREKPHRRMTQLLARAEAAPPVRHQRLRINENGQTWYRGAVLRSNAGNAGLEQTRALFVRANYSWKDPLSARSFAAWRSGLRSKRDQVFSIQSKDGGERFYRLRTETSQGFLRVASLTLRSDTLHPVKGAFRFEDREEVTMSEAGAMPEPHPAAHSAVVETKVTPQEELRVFAALDAIGADAGEPLTVNVDASKHHIVVSGMGIPKDRERAIRQALASMPKMVLRFESGRPAPAGNAIASSHTYSAGASAPLRHTLEEQSGGAQKLQRIADRALNASSSLVAQAHALYVLSRKFPPAVESAFGTADRRTLRTLRRHRAAAIEKAALQLRTTLAPLLVTGEAHKRPRMSWQAGAARLLKQSKLLDTSLSRLLAGSYSQQAGEAILSRLPGEIQNTAALARSQENSP